MYSLNDKQIDYILGDIRARGVEMEDLQSNLLDHICCIVEQNLEENGDFECFYQSTIQKFYKHALWEIEEETIALLTFKNYYVMKKMMILSGAFSAITMIAGVSFKFMHWPGANMLLMLGVLSGCLLFLPLMFLLKAKEQQGKTSKFLTATGACSAILIGLSFLSSVMHWPGTIGLIYTSTIIMLLVFLPLYFYTGIRNPATRVNTISSSVLIVLGYGLILLLVNTRPSIQENASRQANQFLQQSYESISERNNAIYKELGTKEGDHKFPALKEQCNRLCSDIESLKVKLVNETNDINMSRIDYNALQNPASPVRLDNYDVPTQILFDNELSAKPVLMELREKISRLDELAKLQFNANGFDHLVDEKAGNSPKATDWELKNFYHTPLSYLLRNLTQTQLNVRYIELSCIASNKEPALQALVSK